MEPIFISYSQVYLRQAYAKNFGLIRLRFIWDTQLDIFPKLHSLEVLHSPEGEAFG